MRLISVKGLNVGLLKDSFEFNFGKTLTTITGPIGCGKSTMLMMIKSSLTNTIPGSGTSWVSWGARDDEPSYFTVTWELNDHTLEITKPLSDNAVFRKLDLPRVSIQTLEGEVVSEAYTAREGTELLLTMLPVSPKVIDSHLIIEQDQITYPTNATPAKFQETIHILTKVNEMETARTRLRESLGVYTVPEISDEVDTLQSDVDLIKAELDGFTDQVEDLTNELDKIDVATLDGEIALLQEAESNAATKQRISNEIDGFLSQKSIMQTRLSKMEADKVLISKQWSDSKELEASAKESIATYTYKLREWNDYISLQAELDTLAAGKDSLSPPTPPEGDEPDEGMVGILQTKADKAVSLYADTKKKVSLMELGCCPECGQRTDNINKAELLEQAESFKHLVEQVEELLTLVTSKRQEFLEYGLEESRYSDALGRLDENMQRCQSQLDAMSDVENVSPDNLKAWNDTVSAHLTLSTSLETLTRNISDSKLRLEVYETGIVNGKATLSLLSSGEEDPIRLKVLLSQKARVDDLKEKRAGLAGSANAKTSELSRASEKLSIIQKRAASATPIKKYREILEKAIDVLHKNRLPKLVSGQYLTEINLKLEEYLTMVDASFSAWIDEDLQFMVKKPDGLEHRASRLSGGQKQQASIAYLLSVNDVFASSLGVLALDEPTGSMQEENAKDVAEAFSQLVSISKQTERQFIVITHSETLASYGEVQINLRGYM